jgi:cytochrome bd-type quinol oxidase subunit 2
MTTSALTPPRSAAALKSTGPHTTQSSHFTTRLSPNRVSPSQPIPFTITIEDAAAPHSSLAFMFWGEGLFVFPLLLVYTAVSYSVFRGKVRPASVNY